MLDYHQLVQYLINQFHIQQVYLQKPINGQDDDKPIWLIQDAYDRGPNKEPNHFVQYNMPL